MRRRSSIAATAACSSGMHGADRSRIRCSSRSRIRTKWTRRSIRPRRALVSAPRICRRRLPATSDRFFPAIRRSTASRTETGRRCQPKSSAGWRCSAARATARPATSDRTSPTSVPTTPASPGGRRRARRSPAPLDAGAGEGAFKTPTLREIARTAPYMHDGSLQSLEEVVEFYDRGGHANPHLDVEIRPVRFTPDERRALAAFLGALSGQLQEGIKPTRTQ